MLGGGRPLVGSWLGHSPPGKSIRMKKKVNYQNVGVESKKGDASK